jgi:hypothetical protein
MAFALLKSSSLRTCLARASEKVIVLNSRNFLDISFGLIHSSRHTGNLSFSWCLEQFDQEIVVLIFEEGFFAQRCPGGCCLLIFMTSCDLAAAAAVALALAPPSEGIIRFHDFTKVNSSLHSVPFGR